MANEDATSNPTGLSLAAALSRRPEVRKLWYHDQNIVLDGYNFIGCRFDNCKILVRSTNFEIKSCFFDDRCAFFAIGDTLGLARLFSDWHSNHLQRGTLYRPVRHTDGTITINSDVAR